MSQYTTLKCDKCNKEALVDSEEVKNNPFETMEVKFSSPYSKAYYNYNYNKGSITLLLCQDCLKKVGIIRRKKDATPPPESISDKLYDIVAEIISDIIPEQYLQ